MTDIRVLVADDHSVVREGLRRVLSAPGFAVVGEAATGEEAVRRAGELTPDVVVLDISMPEGSGLQIVERLRRAAPAARVLMLSVHDGTEYVLESVRKGAHGYVRKDTTPAELRDAIRSVHAGNEYFSPAVAGHLTAALRDGRPDSAATDPPGTSRTSAPAPTAALAELTGREREVLALIAQGHSNKQAAAALKISPRTVESHRDSLMRKLGIRTVAGLTRFAMQTGLTDQP